MKNVIKRMTMTIIGSLSLLFLVQFGTLAATAGDNVLIGAYCVRVDIPFMEAFTALVVKGGDSAYWGVR